MAIISVLKGSFLNFSNLPRLELTPVDTDVSLNLISFILFALNYFNFVYNLVLKQIRRSHVYARQRHDSQGLESRHSLTKPAHPLNTSCPLPQFIPSITPTDHRVDILIFNHFDTSEYPSVQTILDMTALDATIRYIETGSYLFMKWLDPSGILLSRIHLACIQLKYIALSRNRIVLTHTSFGVWFVYLYQTTCLHLFKISYHHWPGLN